MATRSQIDTFYTTYKDQIISLVTGDMDGTRYKQIKKLQDRNDAQIHVYEGIKGTNRVIAGLFMRVTYDSNGPDNIRWIWRIYYYE